MSDAVEPLGLVEVGDGPPLVAVHGALAGGRLTFEGVARRWGRRSRVLVVDRPGVGYGCRMYQVGIPRILQP